MDQEKSTNQYDELFKQRVTLLKSYIERVSNGEALESVQKDFKENFSNVPAKEIASAEQEMMKDGVPFEKIQKLCDIHSVLFHDMTDEERMQRLKEEMEAHQEVQLIQQYEDDNEKISKKYLEYKNTRGHPCNILVEENSAIQELIKQIKTSNNKDDLISLLDVKSHYLKKDNLLLPLLKDKYGYPGPADVMWDTEDKIIADIKKSIDSSDDEQIEDVLKRIEEMIYKEENILLPLCSDNFTDDEWIQIRGDMDLYGPCLIDQLPLWDQSIPSNLETSVGDDLITLPGGQLTLKQLRAVLNVIPMELTVIDENDINRFFDEDDNKVFLRPQMALNRSVYSCHPPRVMKMVEGLIKTFKEGKKDSFHVLNKKEGKNALVNYYALRDDEGNYLGTLEAILHLDSIINMVENGKKGPVDL